MKKVLGLTLLAVAMLGISTASAQKFARINLQEIVVAMPEFEQAQKNLEAFGKDLQEQMEQIQVEFNNKLADFQKNQATMAASIKQMKQQELEQLQQRFGEFQQIAQQDFQKKEAELMEPVQKKAQEAAREMAAAQKKVAAALEEASTAYSSNDLKGYMSALSKVGGDYTQGMQKGNFSYTSSNLSAFTAYLNDRLAQADLGTTLYQNLTKQLADANMLANLMETAVKNGIDIAQFDPQTLFNKIFGENPGDYIEDANWQELRKKIEELVGKPITIDVNTGTVNVNGNGSKDEQKKNEMHLGQLVNNVQSITRSLNDLGVEIPEGLTKVLSTMNIITTILTTINTLAGISASTSILKSIPVIGWFLHNGGVVHAANGFSGTVPGNYFSGDQVPAMLDSGETVLSKAQSGIVATALNGIENGGFEGRSIATIESDQIRIVLQNGAQAKGMTISEYLGIG